MTFSALARDGLHTGAVRAHAGRGCLPPAAWRASSPGGARVSAARRTTGSGAPPRAAAAAPASAAAPARASSGSAPAAPPAAATEATSGAAHAAARLALGGSAGWVSPSSRGLWGGDPLLLSNGAAGNRIPKVWKAATFESGERTACAGGPREHVEGYQHCGCM
jgi:hypothetical protein